MAAVGAHRSALKVLLLAGAALAAAGLAGCASQPGPEEMAAQKMAAETAQQNEELRTALADLTDEVHSLRAALEGMKPPIAQKPLPPASKPAAPKPAAAMPAVPPRPATPAPAAAAQIPAKPPVGVVLNGNEAVPRSILPADAVLPPIAPGTTGSRHKEADDLLPAPGMAPAKTAQEAATMTAPPMAQPPAPAPSTESQPSEVSSTAGVPSGGVGIHLVSLRKEADTARAWQEMRSQYPDLFSGLSARESAIDFGDGRGTFYRIKAGPLPSKDSATELCRKVRQRGLYCAPSDFVGENIPQQ
ncbi:SPOR domain-containing protein [Radicibacter daui]|uniref:SPOR domain-containing protein n=1 Tax=Radicibacter daui TaxID=3064829 RepID=UPI004046B9ED